MERVSGLEPPTFSLARRRSTTELHPHIIDKLFLLFCYQMFYPPSPKATADLIRLNPLTALSETGPAATKLSYRIKS